MTSKDIDLYHSNDLAVFVESLNDFDLNNLIIATHPQGSFRILRVYAIYVKTTRTRQSNRKARR